MGERRAVTVAAVLWCTAATVVLVGCTPEAAPTPLPLPTATGFASDEEAFAAAEATYRAYVDAVNARRADPDAPDPTTFLSGQALRSELETRQFLLDRGLAIKGDTSASTIERLDWTNQDVLVLICLDSSNTRVLDAAGEDVTPVKRESRSAIEVRFTATPLGMLIASTKASELKC